VNPRGTWTPTGIPTLWIYVRRRVIFGRYSAPVYSNGRDSGLGLARARGSRLNARMDFTMKLVIDSNRLQSEALREFLATSTRNRAVLTDYVAMEAHKGDTLANIYERMAILGDFPRQVVVLKGTRVVCGLRGRTAGLQRRLIDEGQSSEFGVYVRRLRAAQAGNSSYQRQLLERGNDATEHLTKMLGDAKVVVTILEDVTKAFTKDERRLIRLDEPYSPAMVDKVVKTVMYIAASLFKGHPNVTFRPTYKELPNTFIFRASLCMFLMSLHWVAMGGSTDVAPEKMRNDMVDMNIAAYATYFDGLLSADTKARRIHQEARMLLRALFDCPLPSGLGINLPRQ
jgi:hypothetical protein